METNSSKDEFFVILEYIKLLLVFLLIFQSLLNAQ